MDMGVSAKLQANQQPKLEIRLLRTHTLRLNPIRLLSLIQSRSVRFRSDSPTAKSHRANMKCANIPPRFLHLPKSPGKSKKYVQ